MEIGTNQDMLKDSTDNVHDDEDMVMEDLRREEICESV